MSGFKPTEHELKLMRYLHQRGPKERRDILVDCASDSSLISLRGRHTKSGRRFINGSNGAAPMIVARWMKRLITEGLVRENRITLSLGRHQDYRLTTRGQQFVREQGEY